MTLPEALSVLVGGIVSGGGLTTTIAWLRARNKREEAQAAKLRAEAVSTTREGDATAKKFLAEAKALEALPVAIQALVSEVKRSTAKHEVCDETLKNERQQRAVDKAECNRQIQEMGERVRRLESIAPPKP